VASVFWGGQLWANQPVILVLGDSLSAAYGFDTSQGWVALLERRLAQQGFQYSVANASVSGDTTSSGLARIGSALARHDPAIVIIELGANDGLQALAVNSVQQNLAQMIEITQTQGREVLLIGMRLPPNYGTAYVATFEAIYPTLTKSYQLQLVPFLLEGVAAVPDMIQSDGVHPSAEAQPRILDNIWPHLLPLLKTEVSWHTGRSNRYSRYPE